MRASPNLTPDRRAWWLLAALIGLVPGLVLGLQIKVGQGYDCGELGGLQTIFYFLALFALAGIVFLVLLVAALAGRARIAQGALVALLGLGAGAGVGYVIGTPADVCQRATSEGEPAILTLSLDEPFQAEFQGPGQCVRDIASGRVVSVERADEGPTSQNWIRSDFEVFEIAMGYGPTEPGLQISVRRISGTAHVLYRQSADSQVTATTAGDQHSGTYEFRDLPIDDISPAGQEPEAQTLSGMLGWNCPLEPVPAP